MAFNRAMASRPPRDTDIVDALSHPYNAGGLIYHPNRVEVEQDYMRQTWSIRVDIPVEAIVESNHDALQGARRHIVDALAHDGEYLSFGTYNVVVGDQINVTVPRAGTYEVRLVPVPPFRPVRSNPFTDVPREGNADTIVFRDVPVIYENEEPPAPPPAPKSPLADRKARPLDV